MQRVLAITHIECEGPGWWGDFLAKRDVDIHRVRLNDGDRLPDFDLYDGVLVLGGPMNVDEDARFSWLAGEKAAIAAAARGGQPIVGLCLGAQLLARSLGAAVMKNPAKEIGWSAVTLTEHGRRDPLFAGCGTMLPVFQWHGDTFALPDGAIHLAESTLCANQAFRWGRSAYGLQFHVEVTPPMVAEWAREYAGEVRRELPVGAGERMIRQAYDASETACALSRRILDNAIATLGSA